MKIDSFRLFLIILLSLAALALIIIGIVLLIKYFKKSKKVVIISNSNNDSINAVKNNGASVIEHISINTSVNNFNETTNIPKKVKKEKDFLSKEKKIKGYLDCFLKPVKFSLIKVYNESCPIDLIPFNEIDEVSVTKCLHAFHYDCIKKYLLENENHNEYKCPICLTPLFEV